MQPLSLATSEKVIKKLSWTGFAQLDEYANLSFSQMGEDRVLSVLFKEQKNGFYVDIGAHHPKLYSNSYLFYLNGWRGINIDAMPNSMQLFRKLRPKDINLEIAIGRKREKKRYYMFSNSAINTFSTKHVKRMQNMGEHLLTGSKIIETFPLNFILKKHMRKYQVIDFLSVDVEGKGMDVLYSNDWKIYRPKVILIEDLDFSFLNASRSNACKFLFKKGYSLYARAAETLIFVDKNFKR